MITRDIPIAGRPLFRLLSVSRHIHAPLIDMSKADIIREGQRLGVDFGMTVSCYQADASGLACGKCDSCRLRAAGFAAANTPDITRYR